MEKIANIELKGFEFGHPLTVFIKTEEGVIFTMEGPRFKLRYSKDEECIPVFDTKARAIVIGKKLLHWEMLNYLLRQNFASNNKHLTPKTNIL
ncbi:MAG: hypothetical protein NTX00_03700, partial [Candidatus Parcubacteria bacterium]|nr:hypothetical protein [Candidatus Parcubacteria bacterium]